MQSYGAEGPVTSGNSHYLLIIDQVWYYCVGHVTCRWMQIRDCSGWLVELSLRGGVKSIIRIRLRSMKCSVNGIILVYRSVVVVGK